jgi:hypothetical protein
MIAATSVIDGVEARMLKPGDFVLSWNGRRWVKNEIVKVQHGQSRRIYSIFCFDGNGGFRLHCDENQRFGLGRRRPKAKGLMPGRFLNVSEGAHVYKGEIGWIEMRDHDGPQTTVGFELKNGPKNILAEGFLCQV